MTIEQAIRLLDPKTTREEILRIGAEAGHRGARAGVKAVEEACKLACECMAVYDRAIQDNVKLTVENNELRAENEKYKNFWKTKTKMPVLSVMPSIYPPSELLDGLSESQMKHLLELRKRRKENNK